MELSIIRKRLRFNRVALNQVRKRFCERMKITGPNTERLETCEMWSSAMTDCVL